MPADPPLSEGETVLLHVLMAPGSRAENCTADALTDRSKLDRTEVHRVLRSLERRDPPLVRSEIDARLNERFWMTTYDAAGAIDE